MLKNTKRRMRFGTWCKKDTEDETKICYTFRMKESDGEEHTMRFTSDDMVSPSLLPRLRYAWIEKIDRVRKGSEDVWDVVLYED